MDPATSKTCQLCNQQVYPRDIRSDGTCKACARRQYYLSRKDLLAERYRNNREQRLQKQREYYLRKKESKQNGSVKPPSADRNRRKNGNGQQRSRQQELQDYQQHMRNGQTPTNVIVESQPSSSSNAGIDVLSTPSTIVKTSYPFTTSSNESVTTQPVSFIVGPNGAMHNVNIITWEMLQQPRQNSGGPL